MYIKKLRITPEWDIKLDLVEDPAWPKTGDFKIDCDDRKAILLLNVINPKQENMEEVIIHELMHIKMYPLDQVTESLIARSASVRGLMVSISNMSAGTIHGMPASSWAM